MKLTKLAITWLCATGAASAFTVSVTNQAPVGDPSAPIVDNLNNLLTQGTVQVGFFPDDAAVTDNAMNFEGLLAAFTEFGTAAAFTPGFAPGLFNLDTPAEFDVSVPSGTTGGQVGQNIYVVIGNGDSLANSDLLAVFRSDTLFGTEDDAGNGGALANLRLDEGTTLLGGNSGPTEVSAGGTTITYANNIQLVAAVPEPSTSLLAGLAGLGLAFRRRR